MKKSFNIKSIISLRDKLISKELQPSTEEATKQWLIMPMLISLGYDPYSSDIIPEFTLDVGVKKGEKVDYAIQINNQPVAIVECKQLNVNLQDKHIDQLYRYFATSDVHIAILTNGDDYWFFTDSVKTNIMDLKPYYEIKLTQATNDEINKLEIYSKDLIQYTDVAKIVQYEKFQKECEDLVASLRYNHIPNWLIDALLQRSGDIKDVSKSTLAEYLYNEISEQFNGFKKTTRKKRKTNDTDSTDEIIDNDKDNSSKQISNIKLHHEYIFNDYSDGDWQFHKIEYAIIFGEKYEDISARKVLTTVVQQLIDKYSINPNKLAESELFKGGHKIVVGKGEEILDPYYIEEHNISVGTKLGIGNIMKFIEKLLRFAELSDDEIKISFKE